MEDINILKKRLEQEIDKLPTSKLPEVLKYVRFLLAKSQLDDHTPENQDPEKDPILAFIGGVENGSLAKNIDAELHGKIE